MRRLCSWVTGARRLGAMAIAVIVGDLVGCGAAPSPLASAGGAPGGRPGQATATDGTRPAFGSLAALSSSAPTAKALTPAVEGRHVAHVKYQLNGRAFPLPLIEGSVGGIRTLMLVDTGANSHVIAGWLARRAGLPLKRLGDIGTDHAGRAIATYRVEAPRMTVDEWGPLPPGPTLAADVPEAIERMGIGAFVSPQQLAVGGEVLVLDLARAELHAASPEKAEAEMVGRGSPIATHGVRPCIDDASAIKGLAYVIPALIEGSAAALLVDTGAHRTDVLSPSPIGKGLVARSVVNKESMYAASGKLTTRSVKSAHVRIGEWTITTEVDIVPGKSDDVCPRDGVVSMDVLRTCILVLGPTEMMGRCGTY